MYMDNFVGRQNCISERQCSILIGTLLGDGRLECRSKQGSARLRIHHGERQKDLVLWKYNQFKDITSKEPRRIKSWVNPKYGDDYYSWYFHTRTLPEFGKYYQMFYNKKGRKILPLNIDNFLNPLSLGVWYMDDGCNDRKRYIILNTQNFTLSEQKKLQQIFVSKFFLNSHLVKDRDKYRMVFYRDSAVAFLKIINQHVIDSMKYKLSP